MSELDREALTTHVRNVLAQRSATDAWRAEQLVGWLWERRVTLCSHEAPVWSCERDCPAFQAVLARARRAEREWRDGDVMSAYENGYRDGERSAQNDWETALDEYDALPHGIPANPSDVAEYVGELRGRMEGLEK